MSVEKQFIVFLLSPLTLFFRFCSVILANMGEFNRIPPTLCLHKMAFIYFIFVSIADDYVIVTAAKQFSTSVSALLSIIFNENMPPELPEAVAVQIEKLKMEYSKLHSLELPIKNLRKLQMRLFNAVVVYAYLMDSEFPDKKSVCQNSMRVDKFKF